MKNPRKIVIVGGVAGGASAAARARRVNENAEIHLFERGPYISFANCGLPYFIAGEIDDRAKLIVMTPENFWKRSRIHSHVNHEVLSIDRTAKTIRVKGPDGPEHDVPYDRLILSQGAKPIVPPIPGVDLPHVFTLRDIPDMDRIAAFMNERKPRHAVVIGGGFIGLEMAEAFHHRGIHVTVVERNAHILPLLDRDMAIHLQNRIRRADFDFKTGAEAKAFTTEGVQFADGCIIPGRSDLLECRRQSRGGTCQSGRAGNRRDRRRENQRPHGILRPEHLRGWRRRRNDACVDRRAGAHRAGRTGEPPRPHRGRQCSRREDDLSRARSAPPSCAC